MELATSAPGPLLYTGVGWEERAQTVHVEKEVRRELVVRWFDVTGYATHPARRLGSDVDRSHTNPPETSNLDVKETLQSGDGARPR